MRYLIDGHIMSGDEEIAEIKQGLIYPLYKELLPFYLQRCNDLHGWLSRRAVDKHRTNSRLLKRLARLSNADDPDVAMKVYGASITDNFWVRPLGTSFSYKDIKFYANPFDKLALSGDLTSFSDGSWQNPSSPEFTNIGSFEKCWRKEEGFWWLYKSGDIHSKFAELFMCSLGQTLGFPTAQYVLSDCYVKSKDVTENGRFNLDLAYGLIDDNYDDYLLNYETFQLFSNEIAGSYVNMLYFDALCRNVDRHSENYGLLRNSSSGAVVCFSPLFDHNIALFSNDAGDLSTNIYHDFLMSEFCGFIRDNEIPFNQPIITEAALSKLVKDIPLQYDSESVVRFIIERQNEMQKHLCLCKGYSFHNIRFKCNDLIQSAASRAESQISLFPNTTKVSER